MAPTELPRPRPSRRWRDILPPDGLWSEGREGDAVVLRGFTAPPLFVGPALVGTLAFGVVVSAIAAGFCFSCAAQAPPLVPLVLVALLAPYLRGFTLRVRADGDVVVYDTFALVPFRRVRLKRARVSSLLGGPAPRFGAALVGDGGAPVLLGSARSGPRLLAALRAALASSEDAGG